MTLYPGAIDNTTSIPLVVDTVTPVAAVTVNRVREPIIAIETELGINPSGGYSSVAARLSAIESTAIQDLGSGSAVADKVVVTDGVGGLTLQDYSTGVAGSGTDNHIVRWDGTGAVQDSGIIITDTDDITFPNSDNATIKVEAITTPSVAGKSLYIYSGDAGANTFAGYMDVIGGTGGASTSSSKGGSGGRTTIYGGPGGENTSTGDGGTGGSARLIGGDGGSAASGTPGKGGSAYVFGGYSEDTGGDTYVDAGWGNVTLGRLYLGQNARLIEVGASGIPVTINGELYVDDGGSGTAAFLDMVDGASATVSAASHIRLRSNAGKLEVSENGNAYVPLGYVDTGAAKTGAYNAVIGDLVKVDPSGGGFAVTLPTAVGYANQGITIKNVTGSTNVVTFNTTGGQTMDGAASGADQIDTAYETVTFISDGSNWMRFPAA